LISSVGTAEKKAVKIEGKAKKKPEYVAHGTIVHELLKQKSCESKKKGAGDEPLQATKNDKIRRGYVFFTKKKRGGEKKTQNCLQLGVAGRPSGRKSEKDSHAEAKTNETTKPSRIFQISSLFRYWNGKNHQRRSKVTIAGGPRTNGGWGD